MDELPEHQLHGLDLRWNSIRIRHGARVLRSVRLAIPYALHKVLEAAADQFGSMNYLIDAYTIFAASVLAANAVLRSMFGFAFPLFTKCVYPLPPAFTQSL